MVLRRWLQVCLAVLLLFGAPSLASAHGFTIFCGLNARPETLVAGQGGTLDVHIYDPFGNGLPDAQVTVTATQEGQAEQVWQAQEHDDGHYLADVRFPAPGPWKVRVQMTSLGEPFHGVASVTVAAPGGTGQALDNAAVVLIQDPAPGSLPTWLETALGVALLAVPLVLALFWRRKPGGAGGPDGGGAGSGGAERPATEPPAPEPRQ